MYVNSSHPLNYGKIAWWLSSENLVGGKVIYDIIGNKHLTISSGGRWIQPPNTFAAINLSSSSGSYASTGTISAIQSGSASLVIRNPSNIKGKLIRVGDTGFSIGIGSTSTLNTNGNRIFVITEGISSYSGPLLTPNSTNYIAITWQYIDTPLFKKRIKVYVNSSLAIDTGEATVRVTSERVFVGGDTGSYTINADISDVQIWNRVLNENEIRQQHFFAKEMYRNENSPIEWDKFQRFGVEPEPSTITKTTSYNYNILASLGITTRHLYNILTSLTKTTSHTYKVLANVIRTREFGWKVKGIASDIQSVLFKNGANRNKTFKSNIYRGE